MVRLALALLLSFLVPTASAQTVEPGDLRLELSFEDRSGPLYEGEMVLLKVRGFYKIRIARETLKQADLEGFDWMQLGEDTWSKDMSKGGEILQMERVIALFPNRTGTLEIKPFTHELELWTRTGERYTHELASAPITIDVTARPPQDDWWLPARRLTVEDRWSNAPDKLGTGEGALRIVMVTVEGVLPEQVPPMPDLESAGAFVFPHPEVRMTRLYKTGPVTRVFWRWTVRPENPPSAYLKPIRLPYFDTKTRENKEIVIAAQRIAMTDEAVAAYLAEANAASVAAMTDGPTADDAPGDRPRPIGSIAPLALIGGVIGGLLVLRPNLRRGRRKRLRGLLHRLRPDPDITALKRAAARGDESAARRAGVNLIVNGQGDITDMKAALAGFDKHVFGVPGTQPDVKKFAASMLNAHRAMRNAMGSGR